MSDNQWMHRCLDLAQKGAGAVSPNPLVGCVIVDADGEVIGEGYHETHGKTHAEVNAIHDVENAGFAYRFPEATLYVNLEPCSHHGKTPPCADLIIEKKIPQVVVAMQDPNPQVAGRGYKRLLDAGLDVTTGILEKRAKRLNEAFAVHITTGKPLITLKIAQSLDGKVAGPNGEERTISSEASRALVHTWRSRMDAVLVGSGTALADDPQLTVRLTEGHQPMRVVLDREGTLPGSLQVFSDQHADKTVVFTSETVTPAYQSALERRGGRVIQAPEINGHLNLETVFERLGSGDGMPWPVQSVLVEAGPRLSQALLENDLVDRLFVFTSSTMQGEGIPAFQENELMSSLSFADTRWEEHGGDVLFKGYMRKV